MPVPPVVFFVFNRPEVTRKTFSQIACAKPTELMIVADGPRAKSEERLCEAVRAIVSCIDWPCDVIREYSPVNLGCKGRIVSGLKAAFERYEQAIILEDDCKPDESFFRFCEVLLDRYARDQRINMISGSAFRNSKRSSADYHFSLFPYVWGWATWRRSWELYDPDIAQWDQLRKGGWLARKLGSGQLAAAWSRALDDVHSGRVDTWDYQWVLASWLHDQLAIRPAADLVRNIGFGSAATHTGHAGRWFRLLRSHACAAQLSHPAGVTRDEAFDRRFARDVFGVVDAGLLPRLVQQASILERLSPF